MLKLTGGESNSRCQCVLPQTHWQLFLLLLLLLRFIDCSRRSDLLNMPACLL
jgi:hypothetical protein